MITIKKLPGEVVREYVRVEHPEHEAEWVTWFLILLQDPVCQVLLHTAFWAGVRYGKLSPEEVEITANPIQASDTPKQDLPPMPMMYG